MSVFITLLFIPTGLISCNILENKPDNDNEKDKYSLARPRKTSYIATILAIELTVPGTLLVILPTEHNVIGGVGLMLLFLASAIMMSTAGVATASIFRKNKILDETLTGVKNSSKAKQPLINPPIFSPNKYQLRYAKSTF
jgi:hypothetical protein